MELLKENQVFFSFSSNLLLFSFFITHFHVIYYFSFFLFLPILGPFYAYEVDGFGNYYFMDDANFPSLLSLPFLEYCSVDDKIYQNTRTMILGKRNPFYSKGSAGEGVGGPHCGQVFSLKKYFVLIVEGL